MTLVRQRMAGWQSLCGDRESLALRGKGIDSCARDEMMMHTKYMHEQCSLLMHIPIYYNVILVIIMFYGDFPSNTQLMNHREMAQTMKVPAHDTH
jgi:preprotein translocase subunit SecY